MINANSVTIKRRARLFDMNRNDPVFHGTISDKNGQSSVFIEFSPSGIQISNWIIMLCFCLVAIFVNIHSGQKDLIFAAITLVMAIIQYFIIKRGILRGKYEFEREFIYITQKP